MMSAALAPTRTTRVDSSSVSAGDRSDSEPTSSGAPSSLMSRIRRDPQKRATFYNDGVLLLSLAYSAVDIFLQWPEFQSCQKPVGIWLIGSYMMVLAFRLLHYTSQAYTPDGEEDRVLHIRQPVTVPRVLAYFTWLVLLPSFCYWTVMGTYWVSPLVWYGDRSCLPDGAHPWFVIFCQLLCYFWSMLYVVYLMGILRYEYRIYRAEANLRSVETEESIRRWGHMSPEFGAAGEEQQEFSGQNLWGPLLAQGLEPKDIADLPLVVLDSGSASDSLLSGDDHECAICIMGFHSGDSVRRLPSCGHAFHRECIDLWLLRSAACPLCKCGVATSVL